MKVGILRVTLFIPYCRSLKEKRSIVNSVKDRIRTRFNVSIAEVGANDKWQKADIAISMVSNEGKYVVSEMNKILSFLRNYSEATLVSDELEIL